MNSRGMLLYSSAIFISGTAAKAAETVAFTQAAVDAGKNSGKSILIEIAA